MSNQLKAAEGELAAAETRREEAEQRVRELESFASDLKVKAAEAGAGIEKAHAEGQDPNSLADLRRERREARVEADELLSERTSLLNLVERCCREEEAAQVKLERERLKVVLTETDSVGAELLEHLRQLAGRIARIEALHNEGRRSKDRLRALDDAGPNMPYPRDRIMPSGYWEPLREAVLRALQLRDQIERKAS